MILGGWPRTLAEREGFEPSVLENQYAGFRIRGAHAAHRRFPRAPGAWKACCAPSREDRPAHEAKTINLDPLPAPVLAMQAARGNPSINLARSLRAFAGRRSRVERAWA